MPRIARVTEFGEFGGHNTISGIGLQIICIIPPDYRGIQHIIESKCVATG